MSTTTYDEIICCIGAGYVGGTTMAVIAKNCPKVKVVIADIDSKRIAAWNSDNLPIFEPNLKETIEEARRTNNNLFFTTEVAASIKEATIIFVAVSTPTKSYGRGAGKAFDMTAWEIVSREIAKHSETDKIIVEKSTVPVRTADSVKEILRANCSRPIHFEVVSNPEFLAEGSAIHDLEVPDRVLIGGENTPKGQEAIRRVGAIYKCWVSEEKVITSNLYSSELAKLASNAFLAQRISTINAFSAICEESGADVEDVSRILGMDDRIGPKYLKASVGFGGSCLKKDVLALVYIAESYQLHPVAEYFKMIVTINEFQKQRFAVRILETMYGSVRGKKLTVLGFAFKKDTGDIREASAIEIVQFLTSEGANVHIYDPKVPHSEIKELFPKAVCESDPKNACKGAHALIVITEWDEFKTYNYEEIFSTMPKPAFIFDGRNILDHKRLAEIGFHVNAIGKTSELKHLVL